MAKRFIAAVFATFLMGFAQAGVVYNEGDAGSGDLAANSSINLGFVSGQNSVLGQGSRGTDGSDYDGFLFHLDGGQSLIRVIFNAYDPDLRGATAFSMTWHLLAGDYSGSVLSTDGVANILTTDDQEFFGNVLPRVGPGVYAFAPDTNDQSVSPAGTWSYEIIFEVEDNRVPEPESLTLIGLGLLGLAIFRRKRKPA